MAAILDFVKRLYISCLKSYMAENWMLIIHKSITRTYFDTIVAISDFYQKAIYLLLKSYRAENQNLS